MTYVGYKFIVDELGITFKERYLSQRLKANHPLGSGIDIGDEFEAVLNEEGYICLKRKRKRR